MRGKEEFNDKIVHFYKKVIDMLPRFQIEAGKNLNYNVCYPRPQFDKQSMMWDLNYFKYYFLKLGKIPFDEQTLENDFHTFADYLVRSGLQLFPLQGFPVKKYYDQKW